MHVKTVQFKASSEHQNLNALSSDKTHMLLEAASCQSVLSDLQVCLLPTAALLVASMPAITTVTVSGWHGGTICRASDLRLTVTGSSLALAPLRSGLWQATSVTKQYNLVPVKGRLPCDWEVQTKLWSVCGWQVKLCDPLVTHGPCLTSRCCPA